MTERAAVMFVDAVLNLKEGSNSDRQEADFTAFTASAKTWLAATPKPAMSDEERTRRSRIAARR